MAFDNTYKLYDGALNTAPNTNVYPNANFNGTQTNGQVGTLSLGRVGFPFGSQFTVGVKNPSSTGGTGTVLTFVLQYSLDNTATWHTLSTIEFGDPDLKFEGQKTNHIGLDFNAQEYAAANIDVRLQIVPVGTNTSNNTLADKVWAYIGQSEASIFGRQEVADVLWV